jgi:acetyltransferase-like isoleucine patch superfamily enzyme
MNTKILYLYSVLSLILPETRFFNFKSFFLRVAGVKIGNNVRICSSVKIIGDGCLSIGSNTWIGPNILLSSSHPATISIGENVDIAPNVYIGTGSHVIDMIGQNSAGLAYNDSIVIENGVWIGAGAIILPGVKIGKKSVVASGCLVNKDVESFSLIGGVPGKMIRNYK